MQVELKGKSSFSYIDANLDPGDCLIAEANAMSSMGAELDMDAKFNGGVVKGVVKRFLGKESLFVNHFTNKTSDVQSLTLVQGKPGEIMELELQGEGLCLQPGAFVASTPDLNLGVKWAGIGSFIGREGLFKLEAKGSGRLWFGAYGGILKRELDGEVIVDTSHLVAYSPGIKLNAQLSGGLFGSFFSGEGLVTRLEGSGVYYIQTRSIRGLAGWLNPKIV